MAKSIIKSSILEEIPLSDDNDKQIKNTIVINKQSDTNNSKNKQNNSSNHSVSSIKKKDKFDINSISDKEINNLVNENDLKNIEEKLHTSFNHRSKHNSSGDMQTTEYFLFNHVIKHKLLSKEEEIEIVTKKSEAFKKILSTLVIAPDILNLVEGLKKDIIEQNYSLSTIIDLNHLQRLVPDITDSDLSATILERIDNFIDLFHRFSNKIKRLKLSNSDASLKKILDYAEEYKIIDNLLHLSFKRKYFDNLVSKFKQYHKRLDLIEASFAKSRANKKKKDVVLQEEHNQIISNVGYSAKLLYKTLNLMEQYYKEYDQFRNMLINANQRLVYSLARSYAGGNQQLLLDLIQEGFCGLYNGIDKFDLLRGCRLATLLFCWIKHCIQRFCTKMSVIGTPVHANETACQIYRAENLLSDINGYQPSVEQIAEYTGFTVDKICRIRNATKKLVRSDKKISSEGSMSTSDYIVEDNAYSDFKTADILQQANRISGALKSLGAKEEELMRRKMQQEHYGHLPDNSLSTNVNKFVARIPKNQQKTKIKNPAITSVFSASQERIRQIFTRTIYKLRNTNGAIQYKQPGNSNNTKKTTKNLINFNNKNPYIQGPRAYNNELYNWMRSNCIRKQTRN